MGEAHQPLVLHRQADNLVPEGRLKVAQDAVLG
jgi:hypothetical protein